MKFSGNYDQGPNEFSLTQPGLIEKVFEITGTSDANVIHTPTTGAPVGADLGNMHQLLEC